MNTLVSLCTFVFVHALVTIINSGAVQCSEIGATVTERRSVQLMPDRRNRKIVQRRLSNHTRHSTQISMLRQCPVYPASRQPYGVATAGSHSPSIAHPVSYDSIHLPTVAELFPLAVDIGLIIDAKYAYEN